MTENAGGRETPAAPARVTGDAGDRPSRVAADAPLVRTLLGLVLGVACWMIASALGLAAVTGLENEWPLAGCAVIGAALGYRRHVRTMTLLAGPGALLLLLVAYTPIAPLAARGLVRSDPARMERPDAVVVLGSSTTGDGLLGASALERLLTGLMLLGPTDSTTLVTSSLRISPSDSTTNEADLRRLVALAGGRRTVWLANVYSTHDEALEFRAIAARHGWRSAVVVTSPSHSRRACATFERTGIRVTCRPSDERAFRLTRASSPHERLLAWQAVVYEVAGSLLYRLRGWT